MNHLLFINVMTIDSPGSFLELLRAQTVFLDQGVHRGTAGADHAGHVTDIATGLFKGFDQHPFFRFFPGQ